MSNTPKYFVNEVFYSVQGEGHRAGTPNVFVRMMGCNMKCAKEPGPRSPGGFDCDTEFASGREVDLAELHDWMLQEVGRVPAPQEVGGKPARMLPSWMIVTGGEPGLQVDKAFCDYFHGQGWKIAVETNGSVLLPRHQNYPPTIGADELEAGTQALLDTFLVDWITVSPKVAEHAIRQVVAHEVKYVRGYGQAIPRTAVRALHYLISPAFDGQVVSEAVRQHCLQLVKQHPTWALSVQMHKLWGAVR